MSYGDQSEADRLAQFAPIGTPPRKPLSPDGFEPKREHLNARSFYSAVHAAWNRVSVAAYGRCDAAVSPWHADDHVCSKFAEALRVELHAAGFELDARRGVTIVNDPPGGFMPDEFEQARAVHGMVTLDDGRGTEFALDPQERELLAETLLVTKSVLTEELLRRAIAEGESVIGYIDPEGEHVGEWARIDQGGQGGIPALRRGVMARVQRWLGLKAF